MDLVYQLNKPKTEIKYLFIDGAYLDKIINEIGREFWDIENLDVDYNKLRGNFDKVLL